MLIKSIKLENFRNYKKLNTTLASGLNVFIGNNAQGKTNLLESIYYCSIGKSTKTSRDKELIKWGETTSKVKVEVEKQFYSSNIEIITRDKEKKTIKINEIPIKRIGELMGELTVIFFSPDEIRLVKDAPQDRRRFMDIDISQISRNYFYLLCRYDKILNQRNKLLKFTKDFEALKDAISIWDEQLADIASKIINWRINFIEKLSKPAYDIHKFITNGKEELKVTYQGVIGNSVEEIKEKLQKGLTQNLQKDYELGYTTIGPHRDDLKVVINNIDIRSFGSQGQQRLATLSLKLAELNLFKEERGEMPVLLLDDVLSELDDTRQQNLLKIIKDVQTIITCTRYDYSLKETDKIFYIENGKIVKPVTLIVVSSVPARTSIFR